MISRVSLLASETISDNFRCDRGTTFVSNSAALSFDKDRSIFSRQYCFANSLMLRFSEWRICAPRLPMVDMMSEAEAF